MELINLPINSNNEPTYLLVGTTEIDEWTDKKPFCIYLNDEQSFYDNGADYELCKDMKVGEIRKDQVYEGIIYIRIS